MRIYDTSIKLEKLSRTQGGHYSILRTPGTGQAHRSLLRDLRDPPPNMFCSGNCNEATCFEHLCGSCLAEWFDWERERT